MNSNNEYRLPTFWQRIVSVWYRHVRVYTSDFVSNAFPPFFEPLIFLAGLGLGIGSFLKGGATDYLTFLGSGLLMTSAMYTATFECTYATFVRLEFDKIYDGMLGAPLSPRDLLLGEILFAGTKGWFFSAAVFVVLWLLGILKYPLSPLATLVGFITGIIFATLALAVTSIVRNMNHFNFYFTGLISPMFFFSGAIFPLENLPPFLRYVAEVIPLTHLIRMSRAFCLPGGFRVVFLYDLLYCIGITALAGWLALRGMRRRMID